MEDGGVGATFLFAQENADEHQALNFSLSLICCKPAPIKGRPSGLHRSLNSALSIRPEREP